MHCILWIHIDMKFDHNPMYQFIECKGSKRDTHIYFTPSVTCSVQHAMYIVSNMHIFSPRTPGSMRVQHRSNFLLPCFEALKFNEPFSLWLLLHGTYRNAIYTSIDKKINKKQIQTRQIRINIIIRNTKQYNNNKKYQTTTYTRKKYI